MVLASFPYEERIATMLNSAALPSGSCFS